MLHDRKEIDLNLWYKIGELRVLFCMRPEKIRSLFSNYEAVINKGRLFPLMFKSGGEWQIIGNGLIMLLDIVDRMNQEGKKMTKKTFTDSAAMQFISAQEDLEEIAQPEAAQESKPFRVEGDIKQAKPIDFEYLQDKEERKTKRVQLVLKPSLVEKLKARSKENGASMNDYVSQLLEAVLK